jgi:hypothetical protein
MTKTIRRQRREEEDKSTGLLLSHAFGFCSVTEQQPLRGVNVMTDNHHNHGNCGCTSCDIVNLDYDIAETKAAIMYAHNNNDAPVSLHTLYKQLFDYQTQREEAFTQLG